MNLDSSMLKPLCAKVDLTPVAGKCGNGYYILLRKGRTSHTAVSISASVQNDAVVFDFKIRAATNELLGHPPGEKGKEPFLAFRCTEAGDKIYADFGVLPEGTHIREVWENKVYVYACGGFALGAKKETLSSIKRGTATRSIAKAVCGIAGLQDQTMTNKLNKLLSFVATDVIGNSYDAIDAQYDRAVKELARLKAIKSAGASGGVCTTAVCTGRNYHGDFMVGLKASQAKGPKKKAAPKKAKSSKKASVTSINSKKTSSKKTASAK